MDLGDHCLIPGTGPDLPLHPGRVPAEHNLGSRRAGRALGKLETLPKARWAGPPESGAAVGEGSQVLGSGKPGLNGRLPGVRRPLLPRQQGLSADAAEVTGDHHGQTRTRGPRWGPSAQALMGPGGCGGREPEQEVEPPS